MLLSLVLVVVVVAAADPVAPAAVVPAAVVAAVVAAHRKLRQNRIVLILFILTAGNIKVQWAALVESEVVAVEVLQVVLVALAVLADMAVGL